MVFNATFNIFQLYHGITDVLLVEEIGITGENHPSMPSHWQTLSHNAVRVHLTWVGFKLSTLVVIGTDCNVGVNQTTIRSRQSLHWRRQIWLIDWYFMQIQDEQEMCASQNMPVYINYQMVNNSINSNGDLDLWQNDPKINRVLSLP
jgi:hypothetical protein